jgi:hypothetical protein
MMKRIFTLRNAFYSIGILNVIEILQTIPFFPTYEGNPWVTQYPYILFPYKIIIFTIIVPFFFPGIMEKYGEGSDLSARTLTAFLFIMAVVCNVLFLFIVISNTINILGILNIL